MINVQKLIVNREWLGKRVEARNQSRNRGSDARRSLAPLSVIHAQPTDR